MSLKVHYKKNGMNKNMIFFLCHELLLKNFLQKLKN
jgi:hypothetical protein